MDTLEPRPIASDVQVKIENALKRNAQIDASQIAVRIEGTAPGVMGLRKLHFQPLPGREPNYYSMKLR